MRLQAGSSGSTESTVNSASYIVSWRYLNYIVRVFFWLEINEVIAQDGFIMISVKVSKKM